MRHESILTVVVFPAPLGPNSATISPVRTSKERSSTATTPPNRRVSPSVLIILAQILLQLQVNTGDIL